MLNMSGGAGPRVVLDGVLTADECQELIYIARLLSVVGYRAGVSSATCFEVAAAEPAFIVPLMAAREKVRAAVEEAFNSTLLVEFTGLISWRTSAEIAFHFDSNRPYLSQREASAVCYLNTAGADFRGGAFRFEQGSPSHVLPATGRVMAYLAQDVHGVDAVEEGERFTLTLWFTTSPEHDEDPKLLARLPGSFQPAVGLPPSMYALPGGADLRLCRLAMMGMALARQGAPVVGLSGGGIEGGGRVQLAVNLSRLAEWDGGTGRARLVGRAAGTAYAYRGPEGPDRAAQGGGRESPQQAQRDGWDSPDGVVLAAAEFPSIERAVSVLQFWAWRWHAGRCAREDVCGRHLRGGDEPQGDSGAADCSWAAGSLLPVAGMQCGQLEEGGVRWGQQQALGTPAEKGAGGDAKAGAGGAMTSGKGGQLAALCAEVQEASVRLDTYLEGLQRQYNAAVQQWHALGAIF